MNRNKYLSIHTWLKTHFGPATKCENLTCKKKSKSFQWAKLEGRTYRKLRGNFIQLCISCHLKYDKDPNFAIER